MKHTLLLAVLLTVIPFIATAQEQPPAKVVVAHVTQEVVAENRSFLGLVSYDRISRVSTEVSGLVKQVTVDTGDQVKVDGTLVQLNTEMLDKDISLAETRIKQIELQLTLAEKNYSRYKSLLANKGTSEKNVDDARFAVENASLEKQATQRELEKLLLTQKKSVIGAPFTGIVLEKHVDSGDWVQQGTVMISIGSTADLFVKVPIGEQYLPYIEIGQAVNVTINASEEQLTGTVDDILPVADATTKNIFIKVRIAPQGRVIENMSATVHLPVSEKRQLSILPRDAMIKFQGKDFVYTVKEGKASILPINVVTFLGDRVAADNPYFVPGMPVVVEGNERLRPDQPVVISEKN